MKKTRGTLFLLTAALIWGVAFVAQSSASDSIGAFTFNAVRSLLASVFLLAVIGLRKAFAKPAVPPDEVPVQPSPLRGGVLCGLTLFLAVNLQQFGIGAYPPTAAASGRAGFLTATYVILVALFAYFTGQKLHRSVIAATVCCVAGMYMLCLSGGFSGIYLGDVLVLVGSVVFAGYILMVDHYSGLDSLWLSCIQFFVCGGISLAAMFLLEKPDVPTLLSAWIPIVYAGVFSSGVGYTLQMLGQKDAEPAVAAIVMSLESVFAAIAGWILLDERLSGSELLGCVLVFLSVIVAQSPGFMKSRTPAPAEVTAADPLPTQAEGSSVRQ